MQKQIHTTGIDVSFTLPPRFLRIVAAQSHRALDSRMGPLEGEVTTEDLLGKCLVEIWGFTPHPRSQMGRVTGMRFQPGEATGS